MAIKFRKKPEECFHLSLDRTAPEERKLATGALVPWFVCLDCGTKFFMERKLSVTDPKVKKDEA